MRWKIFKANVRTNVKIGKGENVKIKCLLANNSMRYKRPVPQVRPPD